MRVRLSRHGEFQHSEFPPALEQRFWQTMTDRSISIIRDISHKILLIYLVTGFITLSTIILISTIENRIHDIVIWALTYLNGALCLGGLPILAGKPRLASYYQKIMGLITFWAVLMTCLLTMQFYTERLVLQAGYIIVFVYMLAYFLTGMPPLRMLVICLIAGMLPVLPLKLLMNVHLDPLVYFYGVFLGNFLGFMVSNLLVGKDRLSFIRGTLLEIDHQRAQQLTMDLTRITREDPVTGLANRRYFNERMDMEWARAERSGEPLSLLFLDIDFFKAYNDAFGHSQGDVALIAVAQALKSSLHRATDLAARYGGEEFIVILPNTTVDGALYIARTLLANVDQLAIDHPKSLPTGHISVSIGVASCIPGRTTLQSAALIDEADSALYIAKANGRHRVHVFGS